MTTSNGLARVVAVADRLRANEQIDALTVREFLSWFGAKRRGVLVVSEIRQALDVAAVDTDPDFESAYIDGQIRLRSRPVHLPPTGEGLAVSADVVSGTLESVSVSGIALPNEAIDPTHRLSKLPAANNSPVTVNPEAEDREAVTIMLSRGFSQLPVQTSPWEVKGVISWQTIGARLATGQIGVKVKDMLEQHHEVRYDISIFHAIPLIVANDYVLVRGADKKITGIVTASDLSLQFLKLSEPFLLVSEIENQIRQIISKRFDTADLISCKDPSDAARKVERASDLTFGEYIRLLERPDNWLKAALPLDRAVFCKRLLEIRDIRNDVMHFDPDGISPTDTEILREFARFLQRLSTMGIS